MVLLALMSIVLFGLVAVLERVACPWYGRQH
jgi:ABC-type nitrate/sulfonate/bicarbonate transport system permease component